MPGFLKKKKTYVILAILIGGAVWISACANKSNANQYETDTVKKMNLKRTVEVTGNVKPAQRIALSFQQTGTLSRVAKVGDKVKSGDVIAELQDEDANFAVQKASAALQAAQANLNLKLAGEMSQSIHISETAVEQAQASYEKSQSDLENAKITTDNAVQSAQLALDNAKKNQSNGSDTNVQTVEQAQAALFAVLSASIGPMNTGLLDGDKIAGVDDTASNQNYQNLLGAFDSTAIPVAKQSYRAAKAAAQKAFPLIHNLSSSSTDDAYANAASSTIEALGLIQNFLVDVHHILATSLTGSAMSSADLASKTTVIDTDRVSVSAQNTAVVNAAQAVTTARLGIRTSGDALDLAMQNAQLNLEIAQSNAQTTVKAAESAVTINKAAVDSAQASLDLKKAPPRDVDLAPLRAAVAQAQTTVAQAQNDLTKARILAPVDGVVSNVTPHIGELVAAGAASVSMLGNADFDIEVLLPEADVAKVSVGQKATMTFDAFGDGLTFSGVVVSIEPDQTVVQDAVYYKARIQVMDTQGKDIKPGMTANVTIQTAEADNVLVIPNRAVKTDSSTGKTTIQVQKTDKTLETRDIEIGLKGDEGLVEVKSGLKEGETVIVSVLTK